MLEIKSKIDEYVTANDVHQFQLILDASTIFIKSFPNGVISQSDLKLGIELFRRLISVTMVTSLRQYENDYNLQNQILYKKLAVFRACIPESHKELRGLTEMLVGMSENELSKIIPKLN